MRAYFQRWWDVHDSAIPDIHIDLVLLRNVASKPQRIEFKEAGPAALVAALEKVQYDGGTQLGAIGPIAGAEKPDLYLLFTDGISNFGREEPARWMPRSTSSRTPPLPTMRCSTAWP